jgi:hypothetical protein
MVYSFMIPGFLPFAKHFLEHTFVFCGAASCKTKKEPLLTAIAIANGSSVRYLL